MSTDWYQQSLTPPEVVELRIRVGVILETDHAQALAEVYDPLSNVLVAQWSMPHMPASRWMDALALAVEKGTEQLGEALEPF